MPSLGLRAAVAAGGFAAWSPVQITSATVAVYCDSSQISQSGGVASQFTDQSANGRHLTVPAGQAGPSYLASSIGGRPTLRFAGTVGAKNVLRSTGANIDDTQPCELWMVLAQQAWTNGGYIASTTGGLTNVLWQFGSTPQLQLYAGASACANGGLAVAAPGIVSAQFNGASSKLTVNNGLPATGNIGAGHTSGALWLGNSSGLGASNWSQVDVAALLFIQGSVSATERAKLWAYFSTGWSIAVS